MSELNPETMIEVDNKLEAPPFYRLIFLNDDITTFDFVVETLVFHFNHSRNVAEDLARAIDSKGQATVAVLPFEVAEQKGMEISMEANTYNFPLQIRLEKD